MLSLVGCLIPHHQPYQYLLSHSGLLTPAEQWNLWDDVDFKHGAGKWCHKTCEHQGQQKKNSIASVPVPYPCWEPMYDDCFRPKGHNCSNSSQCSRFKTKNHLSGAQEPLYHWMEHFCSWAEHALFCHIICKSRVMLQDFYLQLFFSCWVFDKVNENPSRLAELQSITSRAFFHFQPSVAFDINLGSWTT